MIGVKQDRHGKLAQSQTYSKFAMSTRRQLEGQISSRKYAQHKGNLPWIAPCHGVFL